MASSYPTVFRWKCPDCRLKGEVVVTFPTTPTGAMDQMRAGHKADAEKFGRLCLGNDIVVQPKPLEL